MRGMQADTHAIILAGGSGTRLRPLTYARRKELVPLLGRPLLEHRFLNLREHGVRDVVMACAAGVREIEQHFGDGEALGLRIRYVYEERPLGSGRAVKHAARAAGARGTIVVCNGDVLTNIDLSAMLARHHETGAALSMSLAPVDDPWHFGVVAVDADLRVSRFVEKPPAGQEPSNLINAGTWLWEPLVLDRIADDESAVRDGYAERVLFPGLIEDGLRVQGFREDLWMDIGSPERYLAGTRLLLERRCAEAGRPLLAEGASIAPDAAIHGPAMLDAGARVDARAAMSGPAVLGRNSRLMEGAALLNSVLWEDAVVEPGASVRNSIIGAGAVVGARAEVDGAVLADGARVPERMIASGLKLMPGETARL
jgi:mannose-1-phosphate guanylyltransferase